MRRVRLRRIGLRSVFLLFLVLYAGVGLLVGIGLYGLSRAGLAETVGMTAGMTALDRLGAWSMALFPALYGLIGGFAGLVGAALYNTAAALTGGIRLDLEGSRDVEIEEPGDGGAEEAARTPSEEPPEDG